MLNQFPQYMGPQQQPDNRMPYAYGMNNELPLPMSPSPASSLPPLFPSTMTPELYPQAPFSSPNLTQARYAEGGMVDQQDMMPPTDNQQPQELPPQQQGLSELAQLIQQQGQGEDSILAHINAEEAQLLAQKYGHDINPVTGLPQFGFLKKLGKKAKSFVQKTTPLGGKKFIEHEKKVFRYAAPIAGAIVGGIFGGPAGAAAGGALGGAAGAAVNKKSVPKGAILGGLGGYTYGAGLPMIAPQTGAAMGLGGGAAVGGAGAAGGGSSLSNYIGNARLGTLTNAYGATQAAPAGANAAGGGSLLGSLFDGNLLNKGLLLTALAGTAMRREKAPKQKPLSELASQIPPQWQSYHQSRNASPLRREITPAPMGYSPSYQGEHEYFKDINPWEFHQGGPVNMGLGGHLNGETDGHADDIEARLSDGEYVVDATTVAHLGNGNNRAGAKVLDNMVQNIRHHKGVKGFPPKAKSLQNYMQARSR